jgi:lipopolysaccharide/colanic/teichoic acid biosynthesis glycosyltransferase
MLREQSNGRVSVTISIMYKRWIKRALDIGIASAVLVVSAPLMLLVSALIRMKMGRPIIFRQTRPGLNGQPFTCLKFRTMADRRNDSGVLLPDQERMVPLGAWLRRTSLDELPQFFNILQGDMSLVGPRPEQPYFCEMLESSLDFFSQRHTVRPGITGWAQIKYQYGSTVEDAKRKLELDLFYIKHLSISLDMAIVFETVKVIFLGKGAK